MEGGVRLPPLSMKMMKQRTKIWLCLASGVLALGITLYPLVSNFLGEKNRSLVETRYTEAVEKLDDTELIQAKKKAQDYNATLLNVTDNAYSKKALSQAAESYDELLNVQGDGIMAYVEIPKISVDLPIYHGTEETTLDRGVGHLLGSSLPVGGLGTHCVLTGHSGLSGQKMFSDLDQLEVGDVFYLKTLDETLAYMVLDINKVLPEDTSMLTIDPARDSVTLVTCTPYGVNTHRLLVRGERIELPTAQQMVEQAEFQETPAASTWTSEYLRGLGYGCLGIIDLAALAAIFFLPRRGAKLRKKPLKHKIEKQPRQHKSIFQKRRRGKHEK